MFSKSLLSFIIATGFISFSWASKLHQDYIGRWSVEAVNQMNRHGVPASITLAQGILESGAGQSYLATSANNHFGIKCHGWTGEKVYKDDDKKNECFRAYPDARLSYEDHSLFLVKGSRYASLFALEQTDYKGWAKGLKKAGYATASDYSSRLIELIERYNLNRYDSKKSDLALKESKVIETSNRKTSHEKVDVNMVREVFQQHKYSKYVVARPGDSYYRIAKEFGLGLWELYRYNDREKGKDLLREGEKVFIQPKARRVKGLESYQISGSSKNLIAISQELGVKLKFLKKRNPSIDVTTMQPIGTVIRL